MSRSRKVAILKDKGFRKESYWKTIRREWKQSLKKDPYSDLRNPKEIIEDWDYMDWIYDMRFSRRTTWISKEEWREMKVKTERK